MAEHSAVNRRVVGSSPTCGARSIENGQQLAAHFCVLSSGVDYDLGLRVGNPKGKFYIGQLPSGCWITIAWF